MENCLNCHAYFKFTLQQSKFYICPSCHTAHKRTSVGLTKWATYDKIEEDLSPIMIGTMGEVNHRKFSVIGRIRYHFQDAYFNQWTILLDDDNLAFLGEYEGTYFIYFLDNVGVQPDQLSKLKLGKRITLSNKITYMVTRLAEVNNFVGEGEVAFLPGQESFKHIEFSGDKKATAFIHIYSSNSFLLFAGYYFEFEELNLTQLRLLHGWE